MPRGMGDAKLEAVAEGHRVQTFDPLSQHFNLCLATPTAAATWSSGKDSDVS